MTLANPVMTASGTCGYGTEMAELTDIESLGAVVCKATTMKPRGGNPQPRIAETPCGMLNSIGLQNIGVEALIRDQAPLWEGWGIPVVVNIAGDTVGDYASVAAKLEGVKGISAVEVNISCPNVSAGGAHFGGDPADAAAVTEAVRRATTLPLIVKLSPHTADIAAVAMSVADAGADALTAINSIKGMAMDIKARLPLLGNISGGLSGPAIRPVALHMVYEVAGAVDIPVIGCGGIACGHDAVEFILAGASAIQVGAANLVDPSAAITVLKGIEDYMREEGVENIADLIGAGRR